MIAFLAALIEDRRLLAATTGALAIIGGAFAPWAHIASPLRPITELGLDADGKITILCGTLALGLVAAYIRLRQRDLIAGAGLLALIALGYVVAYEIGLRRASARVLARILEVAPGSIEGSFGVRTGAGVWVSAAGSALLAAAALLLFRSHPPETGQSPAPAPK